MQNKNVNSQLICVLGNIIKKHRLEQNKTMYKISAECSIHKSTWRLIEQGLIKDIKFTTLWKMAEGLDVPLSSLIDEISKELGNDFSLADLK